MFPSIQTFHAIWSRSHFIKQFQPVFFNSLKCIFQKSSNASSVRPSSCLPNQAGFEASCSQPPSQEKRGRSDHYPNSLLFVFKGLFDLSPKHTFLRFIFSPRVCTDGTEFWAKRGPSWSLCSAEAKGRPNHQVPSSMFVAVAPGLGTKKVLFTATRLRCWSKWFLSWPAFKLVSTCWARWKTAAIENDAQTACVFVPSVLCSFLLSVCLWPRWKGNNSPSCAVNWTATTLPSFSRASFFSPAFVFLFPRLSAILHFVNLLFFPCFHLLC